ncbi:MAG TPA: hypothetical protein VFV99_18675 [Kofleriaceae bacterium]|nr:hypothetical protein [Kofleriaceae bacterium]
MNRLALIVAIDALAGCWGGGKPPDALSNANHTPAARRTFEMRLDGVGPLGWKSEATEAALRIALPELTIKTNDLGAESGIVFDVFDGTEKLMYVVPDEQERDETGTHHYDKTIFSIFATSPRISVSGHSWRVGYPLENANDLMGCECWGEGEVTACTIRAHLAVIFEENCEVARDAGPQAMVGHKIGRIMWKRVADD